jgi:hypothetical protein
MKTQMKMKRVLLTVYVTVEVPKDVDADEITLEVPRKLVHPCHVEGDRIVGASVIEHQTDAAEDLQ